MPPSAETQIQPQGAPFTEALGWFVPMSDKCRLSPHFTSKLPLSRICSEELPTITLNVPGSTRRVMLWS